MSHEVYSDGNSFAAKAGGGKVIAAFPDVCLSPPSPPAGPIPVPYPNTSFSKDMKNGSKSVKIGNKEIMLKNKSFYKTSPLGDEAATRSFGASVITHVITGKTYFIAWSMDVKAEGKNIPRNFDLTTSNHASYPGSTAPMTNMQKKAIRRMKRGKCPCCGKPGDKCPAGLPPFRSKETTPGDASGVKYTPQEAYSFREWHHLDETDRRGNLTNRAMQRRAALAAPENACDGGDCPNAGKAPDERKSDPPCDVYRPMTMSQRNDCRNKYDDDEDLKARLRDHHGVDPEATGADAQIDHRTPRAAGGCPSSKDNTVANAKLCQGCKNTDVLLDRWSGRESDARSRALGLI